MQGNTHPCGGLEGVAKNVVSGPETGLAFELVTAAGDVVRCSTYPALKEAPREGQRIIVQGGWRTERMDNLVLSSFRSC